MKSYIGSKIIQAEAMDLDLFNSKSDRIIPAPEYASKEGYRVVYPDGYVSWSPKDVFENAYREITAGERAMI